MFLAALLRGAINSASGGSLFPDTTGDSLQHMFQICAPYSIGPTSIKVNTINCNGGYGTAHIFNNKKGTAENLRDTEDNMLVW